MDPEGPRSGKEAELAEKEPPRSPPEERLLTRRGRRDEGGRTPEPAASYSTTRKVVRLFLERPALVMLIATGLEAPWLRVLMRLAATPLPTK